MQKIKLTEQQMNSLDLIIDYLSDHDSTISETIIRDYKDCSLYDIIQDLCDIYNNSLD